MHVYEFSEHSRSPRENQVRAHTQRGCSGAGEIERRQECVVGLQAKLAAKDAQLAEQAQELQQAQHAKCDCDLTARLRVPRASSAVGPVPGLNTGGMYAQ